MSRTSLRIKLGAMMFFQYAMWGAWTPILAATIQSRLHASGVETGYIYGILWLACMITPFIGGQLVDRYLPSQGFMGIAAVVCALSAYMMATQQTISGLGGWMWVWSLFFAPTLGISNSIVFYHLSKENTSAATQERDFSRIRTAGTVGWILAAIILTVMLRGRPALAPGAWAPFEEMYLAAAFGAVLAVVCLLIPNTPPSRQSKDPWAFTKAFKLFATVPGFAVFMVISFLASTEFQFYYMLSSPFMENGLGIEHDKVSLYKSIAQAAEIISLALFTPLSLRYLGIKWTLVIGTLAWPLRYFIFALGQPTWLVLASMSFHGIGFAFVFVTSYIYIDRVAPKDIRASAQSLFTLITLGLGNYLGTMFCGRLQDFYTTAVPGSVNKVIEWPRIFLIPALLTVLCAAAFTIFFREPAPATDSEGTMGDGVGLAPVN
ncbi:MAG: MFS transporter [Chthonomonadaceae bacterium]|nr:MFS transporter [Chthonomonadaceae bacterium]